MNLSDACTRIMDTLTMTQQETLSNCFCGMSHEEMKDQARGLLKVTPEVIIAIS